MDTTRNGELDEFMDLAQGGNSKPSDDDDDCLEECSPTPDTSPGGPEKRSDGDLTQWARNGEGYIPVGSTLQKLKPGMYNLHYMQNRWTWIQQKVTTDNLLRLPDSKSDEVIHEIERFWKMKDRFKAMGFSYKRGFLLWGPPGSGKTSTIAIVTKQLVDEGGVVLLANSASPDVIANQLQAIRNVEPERKMVVLLEDIDTTIRKYGEAEVLAILDGESSIDNVVYLATTNYPENLDGRVINRPSRFDRVVKIDVPSADARRAYLKSRKLELSDAELEKWVKQTEGFSIAHLKEMIIGVLCYENEFDAEITRLRSMFRTPKSDDPNQPMGFGTKKTGFGQ